MIETKHIDINGHDYACTQFPARKGVALQARMLKLCGSGIASLLSGGMSAEVNFTPVIAAITEKLDENDVVKFIEDILACTRRDGAELTPTAIDSVFVGEYLDLFKAVKFVLEVNFASFFAGIGAVMSTAAVPETTLAKPVKRQVLRTS